MPPFTHPWQCNQSWRRPRYSHSMYGPGCPRFHQVPRAGFPWARPNPMSFLMSEMLHREPGFRRQYGDQRRCHPEQYPCRDPHARNQHETDPCHCSQNAPSRTRSTPCSCDTSMRPEQPRCSNRTSRGQGQSRCRMENTQYPDPCEFMENVALPVIAEMLSTEHRESKKPEGAGACSSEMPSNHTCPDETLDAAFDALVDIIAPFLDDITASYPHPQQHSKEHDTKQTKKESKDAEEQGQGNSSPPSTGTSTFTKSLKNKMVDATTSAKSGEAMLSTDKDTPSRTKDEQPTEPATSQATKDPKPSDTHCGHEPKKQGSENARRPNDGSNPVETPFDVMMNLLGPFMHQMAQAHNQQQGPPRSKTPPKSKESQRPNEGASTTTARSNQGQQEEFVTIPTWFGPMKVKVQKKASNTSQCRKDTSKPVPNSCQKEADHEAPKPKHEEDSGSPPVVTAEHVTSNQVVESEHDTQTPDSPAHQTSSSSTNTNTSSSDEQKVEVAASQSTNEIPDTITNQQNMEEEVPFLPNDQEPITLEFNPPNSDPLEEDKAEMTETLDDDLVDTKEQSENTPEAKVSSVSENEAQVGNDEECEMQEPMERENEPMQSIQSYIVEKEPVQSIQQCIVDTTPGNDPLANEQMVEDLSADDLEAPTSPMDEPQQPFVEEPESDEDFVVVEKDVLQAADNAKEDPFVDDDGHNDQKDPIFGTTELNHPTANQEERTSPYSETPPPEQKLWSATFDLRDYTPEEIDVKTVGQQLVVEAEHQEETEDGLVSQQFRKTVTIPADVDPEDIACSLDDNGVLSAKAFRSKPTERPVPIDLD